MMGTGVPRVSCRDPPVSGHVRAPLLLCVVLWLCPLQVRSINGRLGI